MAKKKAATACKPKTVKSMKRAVSKVKNAARTLGKIGGTVSAKKKKAKAKKRK